LNDDSPAPKFVSEPANAAALVGGTANFTAIAAGAPPLWYQWHREGVDIPAATANSLVLTNLQFSDADVYRVTVTNAFGEITSSNAMLIVLTAPPVVQVGFAAGLPVLNLSGDLGCVCALEYTCCLGGTNQWIGLGSFLLTNPPQVFVDFSASNSPTRFYRLRVPP